MNYYLQVTCSEKLNSIKLDNDLSFFLKDYFDVFYTDLSAKICFLPELIKPRLTGIYYGHEFCSRLVPDSKELKEVVNFISDNDLDLVYVINYSTNSDLLKHQDNISFLKSEIGNNFSVSVNDIGALYLLAQKYPDVDKSLGRIFFKNKRLEREQLLSLEPNFNYIEKKYWQNIKNNQLKAIKEVSFKDDYLIKKFKLSKIDFDLLNTGISIKDNLSYGFYWPYTYITSGRNCFMRSLNNKKSKYYFIDSDCGKFCKNSYIIINDQFIEKENALYSLNSKYLFDNKYLLNDLDRIIISL